MTVEKVFEHIGLSRDQVRSLVGGAAPVEMETIETTPRTRPRPSCLVCAKTINARNCRPTKNLVGQRKGNVARHRQLR